jgi:hypothetical protein
VLPELLPATLEPTPPALLVSPEGLPVEEPSVLEPLLRGELDPVTPRPDVLDPGRLVGTLPGDVEHAASVTTLKAHRWACAPISTSPSHLTRPTVDER